MSPRVEKIRLVAYGLALAIHKGYRWGVAEADSRMARRRREAAVKKRLEREHAEVQALLGERGTDGWHDYDPSSAPPNGMGTVSVEEYEALIDAQLDNCTQLPPWPDESEPVSVPEESPLR